MLYIVMKYTVHYTTRSTQRAQTSATAERQTFPDPDRDPEQTPGSG